jgi:DNA-binding NarL/FixJ family response regulator
MIGRGEALEGVRPPDVLNGQAAIGVATVPASYNTRPLTKGIPLGYPDHQVAEPFIPGWSARDTTPFSPAQPGLVAGPSDILRDARVLIVDDCTLHRENLAALISINGAAEVATAWELQTLVRAVHDIAPSVMLLNIATVGCPMLLRSALEIAPAVRVIVVGVSEDDETRIVECAEAGAASYHTREDSIEDLLILVAKVNAGEPVCSPRVSATLIRRLSALASQRPAAPGELALTTRETEILRMLKLGLSNREIADELYIAVHTVKNHVHSLLTKLGVNSRAQAAALADSIH